MSFQIKNIPMVVFFFVMVAGLSLGRCEDSPEVLMEHSSSLSGGNPLEDSSVNVNAAAPQGSSSNPFLKQSNNNSIDEFDVCDMEISEIIKLIAEKSGLKVDGGENLTGGMSISLKNVDARDLLRIVLDANGLAYMEESGVIHVMPVSEYESRFVNHFGKDTRSAIIKIKNGRSADFKNIVEKIKSSAGKIFIDDQSNSLILLDSPEKVLAMKELIQEVDVPTKTEVFTLGYSKAGEMALKVQKVLTPQVGSLKFDERSNTLTATDTAKNMEEVRDLIQMWDQEESEILIDAKILQIVLSDEHKTGVDWEAIVSDYRSLKFKNNLEILGNKDKNGKLSMGTLTREDFEVLLDALDAVGKTNILSTPQITTLNNHEAIILIGSTEIFNSVKSPGSGSLPLKSAKSQPEISPVELGVKLFLTPIRTEDKFITMKIKPEIVSVSRNQGDDDARPLVETAQRETLMMFKEGMTIVIGGLLQDEKIESIKKIPVLGDIPFLGLAFRNEDQLIRKTEMVIFLTPRVLSGKSAEK